MNRPPADLSRRRPLEPARFDRALAERAAVADSLALLFDAPPNHRQPLAVQAAHSGNPRAVLAQLLERLHDYRSTTLHAALLLVSAAIAPVQQVLLDGLSVASNDHQRPDLQRLAAASIVAQMAGEALSPGFMESLRDPTAAALRSLEVSLEEATASPGLLLDYMDSVLAAEPEIHSVFLANLCAVGNRLTVPPLRVLALASPVSSAAIDELLRLAQLRDDDCSPTATAALFSLIPLLPPSRRPTAERAIRKLQLSTPLGAEVPALPDPAPGNRAFLSLLDGRGTQMLWLAVPDGDDYEVINVVLHEEIGVKDALGQMHYPATALPPPSPVGTQHSRLIYDLSPAAINREIRESLREIVAGDPHAETELEGVLAEAELEADVEEEDLPHLEVDYDYARSLLLAAHVQTWAQERDLPLGYQLFSGSVWQATPPQAPLISLPPAERLYSIQEVEEAVLGLLAGHYFVGWFVETPQVYDEVEQIMAMMPRRKPGKRKQEQLDFELRAATLRIATQAFAGHRLAATADRLTRMAEWLTIAGEEDMAALALGVGHSLATIAPHFHPLVLAMVRRGIEVAAEALAHGFDLRSDPERFGYFEGQG